MFSKRVHFAPTNTLYETETAYGTESVSDASSPSLSFSSLASSSSPAPITPPQEDRDLFRQPAVYPRTPYATANLELYSDIVVPKLTQIHFLLAYSPYNDPPLNYDLSRLPPHLVGGPYPKYHPFFEPATSPPMNSFVITHPLLKFDIEVTPGDDALDVPYGDGSFVSVADVLTCLYRELRLAIHPVEYAELEEHDVKRGVDAAYYIRCGRIQDMHERMREEKKGIKKVDLLMGSTHFMGISGTLNGPDVWELNIA